MKHTRHQSTATRLITRHGGAGALVRAGEVTGPEWAPVFGPELVLPVTILETGYQQDYHAGTLIQAGDKLGLMAVSASVTPGLSDRLEIDGREYQMVEVKPVQPAPGGAVVAYSYQARA